MKQLKYVAIWLILFMTGIVFGSGAGIFFMHLWSGVRGIVAIFGPFLMLLLAAGSFFIIVCCIYAIVDEDFWDF